MAFPKPDFKIGAKDKNLTTTRDFSVIIPKSEREEFIMEIRASQIEEIRQVCINAKETNIYLEILLFVASSLIGSILCAAFSDMKVTDFWGKINFIFFPILCSILITTYFFLRKENIESLNNLKKQILNKLPNPKEERDENEYR